MHTISVKTHIFLTGATGYIGGSVLSRLLAHHKSDSFQITVLTRDETKTHLFKSVGVKAVVGSHDDIKLVESLAAEADVIFACADSDDLDAANAILEGMKHRHAKTGGIASLIHTSGTGVLVDNAHGMHSTSTIYSDMNIKQLEGLAPTQPHREVDLTLVEADETSTLKTHIILPPTIYGIASGSLVDLKVQNSHSQQIPGLIKVSLDRRQGGMVGAGKNMWPNVHIDDVAKLYITLFDAIQSPTPPAHGRSGFYFAENGEHHLYDIAAEISRVLFDLGKGESPVPTTFTEDEMKKYFPDGTSLGTNSRCRAERARLLEWAPKHGTEHMLKSIKIEVEALLKRA